MIDFEKRLQQLEPWTTHEEANVRLRALTRELAAERGALAERLQKAERGRMNAHAWGKRRRDERNEARKEIDGLRAELDALEEERDALRQMMHDADQAMTRCGLLDEKLDRVMEAIHPDRVRESIPAGAPNNVRRAINRQADDQNELYIKCKSIMEDEV